MNSWLIPISLLLSILIVVYRSTRSQACLHVLRSIRQNHPLLSRRLLSTLSVLVGRSPMSRCVSTICASPIDARRVNERSCVEVSVRPNAVELCVFVLLNTFLHCMCTFAQILNLAGSGQCCQSFSSQWHSPCLWDERSLSPTTRCVQLFGIE